MKHSQQGLGTFGALIIIAIACIAGYYVYKGAFEPDPAPSCKAALNSCIASCRRTTTEASASQSCQDACQREADACSRK